MTEMVRAVVCYYCPSTYTCSCNTRKDSQSSALSRAHCMMTGKLQTLNQGGS